SGGGPDRRHSLVSTRPASRPSRGSLSVPCFSGARFLRTPDRERFPQVWAEVFAGLEIRSRIECSGGAAGRQFRNPVLAVPALRWRRSDLLERRVSDAGLRIQRAVGDRGRLRVAPRFRTPGSGGGALRIVDLLEIHPAPPVYARVGYRPHHS